MPFRVDLDGVGSFTTDDLTMAESRAIEEATGHSWYEINPFRSAVDCTAIMVAFLSRTLAPDVAAKQVDALTVSQVLKAMSVVEEDLPAVYVDGMPDPKAGAE